MKIKRFKMLLLSKNVKNKTNLIYFWNDIYSTLIFKNTRLEKFFNDFIIFSTKSLHKIIFVNYTNTINTTIF